MRIIGGKYRGKKLLSPQSAAVRPTSDKAREALFNILRARLGSDFSKLKLLDVFTGSGAFGLEAVSQGFALVAMIDIDLTDAKTGEKLPPVNVSTAIVVNGKHNGSHQATGNDYTVYVAVSGLALVVAAMAGYRKLKGNA